MNTYPKGVDEPLRSLDPQQAAAACFQPAQGQLLIEGGSGTGKSTVLAARAAWLVNQTVCGADQITVLVPSPEAVEVTRTRIGLRLPGQARSITVSTLPDFCHQTLRSVAPERLGDSFVIPATRTERIALLAANRRELKLLHHDSGAQITPLMAAAVGRIDRLKESGVDLPRFQTWLNTLAHDDQRREREVEFERIFALHDQLLRDIGGIDHGQLLLELLSACRSGDSVLPLVAAGCQQLLIDDFQDLPTAGLELALTLARSGCQLVVAQDPEQATRRVFAAATHNSDQLRAQLSSLQTITLRTPWRSSRQVEQLGRALLGNNKPAAEPTPKADHEGSAGATHGQSDSLGCAEQNGQIEFWAAESLRAQAQAVAARVQKLLTDNSPQQIAVVVGSIRRESAPLAAAFTELAIPFSVGGSAAFFDRIEVRDVLAWLRLLIDPADPPALSRILSRSPVELRSSELARAIQISKRNRNDLVSALASGLDAPQISQEARDRLIAFMQLYRGASRAIDLLPPDQFLLRLIDRLGLRRQHLFSTNSDDIARLRDLSHLSNLAERFMQMQPGTAAREFAVWLASLAEVATSPESKIEYAPFAMGGTGLKTEDSSEGRVRILPIDGCKELEVDHLLVVGLQGSRYSVTASKNDRKLVDSLPSELLPEPDVGGSDAISELEIRRGLYVAATRARRTLVFAASETSAGGSPRQPTPIVDQARKLVAAEWTSCPEQLFGPDDALHAKFRELRDSLISDVSTLGNRLGELRLDTDVDLAQGVSRYLELVKVAALLRRPDDHSLRDALPAVDAIIRAGASPHQLEILQTSSLDGELEQAAVTGQSKPVASNAERSLEAFLNRSNGSLVLSATDLQIYTSCPLRYKFSRVLKVPQQPTVAQRFGIVVHQVLERWHQAEGTAHAELTRLLDESWRRSGLQGADDELRLRQRAEQAMGTYFNRRMSEVSEVAWIEKSFEFSLAGHTVRGRIDRVDRHPDGSFELIDYKTGRPKTEDQLRSDLQLQLYSLAAERSWAIEAPALTFHYVLDDEKVMLATDEGGPARVARTVEEVGGQILEQQFEPTPSYEACSWCDYRLSCPAVET